MVTGIFRLGELFSHFPALHSVIDVDRLVEVDAAIEEFTNAIEELKGSLYVEGTTIQAQDYDKLLELVTDLRELFRHLEEHCQEAGQALWQISSVVASKTESTATI